MTVFAQADAAARAAEQAAGSLSATQAGAVIVGLFLLFALLVGVLYGAARLLLPGLLAKVAADQAWLQAEVKRLSEEAAEREDRLNREWRDRHREQADRFIEAMRESHARFSADLDRTAKANAADVERLIKAMEAGELRRGVDVQNIVQRMQRHEDELDGVRGELGGVKAALESLKGRRGGREPG